MEVVGIDQMKTAYIECAIWSSEPDGEDWGDLEVAPETLERFASDCAEFLAANGDAVGGGSSQAGYDFWLTRNGHGAGFWDGDWPEPQASTLTDAARAFGVCELYVGDDGKIYAT